MFLFTYAVVPLERVQDALRLMKQPSNVRVDAYAVTYAEMGTCRLSAQLPAKTRHSKTVLEANSSCFRSTSVLPQFYNVNFALNPTPAFDVSR